MKKTREYYNLLFDCYESLLTEKEREYFINYYIEDLSLKEIAENSKVSRSAVQKRIKDTTKKLEDFEKKLNILAKNILLNKALTKKEILEIKKIITSVLTK